MIGQIAKARLVKGKVWQVRRVTGINSSMNSKLFAGGLFRSKNRKYVLLCNDLAYKIARVKFARVSFGN